MDARPGTRRSLARRRAAVVAVPVLALAVFVNALGNAFVFDDVYQVVTNRWIRDLDHLGEIFTTHAFAGRESSYYRPLLHVAYAGLYAVFGASAAAFRAFGMLLHALSALLVLLLAERLGWTAGADRRVAATTGALMGALLFAVHPVHVEAVAWISSLPDVASTAFALAALLAYVVAREPPARAARLHAAGALAFLAAMLFKEPALALVAVVALLDLVRTRPVYPVAFWGTRYGGLSVAAAVYLVLRINALRGVAPHASESVYGLGPALNVAGAALWRYIAMLAWPSPLNVFRTMDDATGLPAWLALLGLPAVLILAWRCGDRRATVGLGLILFPLLPALAAPALLPGLDSPWAERYVYLPSAGFAILVAGAIDRVSRHRPGMRRSAIAALALVIAAFAGMTVARNRVWATDLALWTDAVAKSPRAAAPRAYLGWALFSGGDVDGAIAQYRLAIALSPTVADAHGNLGVALATQGRHEAALPFYAEALRRTPRDAVLRANLALSLSRLGRHDEASREARRAVELDPRSARAYASLGVALGGAGLIAEAADAFRQAVALDPTDAQHRENLGQAERLLSGARPPR